MPEAQERSRLSVLQNLMERGGKARCAQVERKGLKRIVTMHTNRWHS